LAGETGYGRFGGVGRINEVRHTGQSSGKGMVGKGMMKIRAWLHSSANHSSAILSLTQHPTSKDQCDANWRICGSIFLFSTRTQRGAGMDN
jgi:hypothetical protein